MRSLLISASLLALLAPAAHAQMSGTPASAAEAEPGRYLVYFDFDRSTLTQSGRQVVGQAAEEYKRLGSARLAVTGHTDRSGSNAYNQALSERRAETVRRELIRLGVPAAAIGTVADGEADPAVQTADGVREGRNRRVEIVMPLAEPAPAPVAAMPMEPALAPAPMPAERVAKAAFTIGGIYGHNYQETDDNNESDLAGVEISVGTLIARTLTLSLDQSAVYSFNAVDEGWGGRTVLGLDVELPFSAFHPYIGFNAGGVYGEAIQDGFVVGPEAGLKIDLGENVFLYAKAAYDFQFRNPEWDEGIILGGAGLGFKF